MTITKTFLKNLTDVELRYYLDEKRHAISIASANSRMRAVNAAITTYNKVAAEARRRGWNFKDK